MHWLPAILIIPYLIILSCIYRGLRNIKAFKVESDPVGFVSVVVACRNEEKKLPRLLEYLSDQDYPAHLYEVIVVNDNSRDQTYRIASSFTGRCSFKTLNNDGIGKKKALATGISAASGKLIITTDADCSMGREWIRTIVSFYEKEKPGLIICPVQLKSSQGFFGIFQELEFLSLQGITAGTANRNNYTMCNGANLAYCKQVYLNHSANLHPEIATGDDIFLLHSIKKDPRVKILWLESPHAKVNTDSSPSLISYLEQRKRWISKSKSYDDTYSILLGIVTFVTILTSLFLLIAGIFDHRFLPVFMAVFLLKSFPDFLILKNTCLRYDKKKLMNWFIPAQIVYPFYIIAVLAFTLSGSTKRSN
jgi:poly-beta-1,6-N-acetyl-D-glucosamine synthase